MKLIVFFIFLQVVFVGNVTGQAKCVVLKEGVETHRGGSELITYDDPVVYKRLSGKVVDLDLKPLSRVLVEVFDKPEWISRGKNEGDIDQRRIAACETGSGGEFSFPEIASGNYELRISKEGGWNVYHILIRVSRTRSTRHKQQLSVRLAPAT